MKQDIHPEYYANAKFKCACGNILQVGSTKKEVSVEICYRCHPFYTGKHKLVDSAGRIEKFRQKQAKVSKKISHR